MTETCAVDFHCHLDLYPDMEAAYRKCGNSGCETLAVTTTPKAFARNQLYARQFQNIHVALGLHPQAVASRASEVAIFEQMIASTRFVGEVGLDATRVHYSSFEIQKKVFDRILKACFDNGGKILSIHSARCAKHVLDAIERSKVHKNCNVILHWFSASRSEIRRATEMGCWFSVNSTLLQTDAGNRLLAAIPKSRLLTETDGPFIEVEGRPIRPGEVEDTLTKIADYFKIEPLRVHTLIHENVTSLLQS